MSNRKKLEKWGAVALVALCAFLVFRLVREIMGTPAPEVDPDTTVTSPASKAATSSRKAAGKKESAASNSDPILQVQPLQVYAPGRLPDISRDPFDFGAPPVTPAQRAAQSARAAAAMTASSAPRTPQIPLRAIGYTVRTGVGQEAFLADSQQVYVVRQGEMVSRRYKILKITPTMVEVKDGASGERAQLPIPQVH